MTATHSAQALPVLPAALVGNSKQKYTLAQSRLQRGGLELALLSLHGSLMDGLASYVLTYAPAYQYAGLPDLLGYLRDDPRLPLATDAAEPLYLVDDVHRRLVQGEPVTLAVESVFGWMQAAGHVLTRYGVVVSPPETMPRRSPADPAPRKPAPTVPVPAAVRHIQTVLLAAIAVLLALILIARVPWAELVPAPDSLPARTATATRQSAGSMPGMAGLQAGDTAYIRTSGEEPVGLQIAPGAAGVGQVRATLAPDTAVQVIAGPVVVDGEGWWQVRVFNLDGWCPGRLLEVR